MITLYRVLSAAIALVAVTAAAQPPDLTRVEAQLVASTKQAVLACTDAGALSLAQCRMLKVNGPASKQARDIVEVVEQLRQTLAMQCPAETHAPCVEQIDRLLLHGISGP